MINVDVRNGNFEEAFKKFNRICNKDGFMKEIRDRRYFKKPSAKKHEQDGIRKRQMEINRKNDY